MHSILYQIDTKPFTEERLLTPDNIEVGDMTLLDYTYDMEEKARAINIRILVGTILPAGMFTIDTDNNLVYQGGFKIWRKTYFDNVKACMKSLTPANIMGDGNALRNLNKAFRNPLKTVRLFVCGDYEPDQSIAFMRLVDGLKKVMFFMSAQLWAFTLNTYTNGIYDRTNTYLGIMLSNQRR